MVSAYNRHLGDVAAKKSKPSEYIGTVGKREVFALIVIRIIPFESMYGQKWITILQDREGNKVVWYASVLPDFEEGDSIVAAATVKEHKEYRAEKQTVVSRLNCPDYVSLQAYCEKKRNPDRRQGGRNGYYPRPGTP